MVKRGRLAGPTGCPQPRQRAGRRSSRRRDVRREPPFPGLDVETPLLEWQCPDSVEVDARRRSGHAETPSVHSPVRCGGAGVVLAGSFGVSLEDRRRVWLEGRPLRACGCVVGGNTSGRAWSTADRRRGLVGDCNQPVRTIAMALQVARGESSPPLWYGIGWAVHVVGVPVEWVRLLSIAAMLGAVVLTAMIARRAGLPMWSAGLAGMLVAFGDQFVAHGAELRAYALFCMLAALFALVVQGAVPHPSRTRLWSISAVVAAGTLTHYFFLFSVVAAVIWLWINREARSARRRMVGMIGVGLLPLALWSPVAAHQYGAERYGWIGRFSVHAVAESVSGLFVNAWVLRSVSSWAYLIVRSWLESVS